jgi:hypothetical protein
MFIKIDEENVGMEEARCFRLKAFFNRFKISIIGSSKSMVFQI